MSEPDHQTASIAETKTDNSGNENVCIVVETANGEARDQLERWLKKLTSIDARTIQLPAALSQRLEIENRWTHLVQTQEGITKVVNNQRGLIATIQYAEGRMNKF